MGIKFDRFKQEISKTFKNIGSATEKTLSSLDNPQMRKMDEDMKKLLKDDF
jgi:hypothetical protein